MNAQSRDIVVVGGSAGAPAVTIALLSALPPDFRAAVFVVVHQEPATRGLSRLLGLNTQLPVHPARDNHPIELGNVYVAPGDNHLVLENGLMRLEHSPKEQRFRPTIDVLFKSAALTYGRRVVGVVLSGRWGQDGTAGLWQIKNRGGVAIVQDPSDAEHDMMPKSAIDNVCVDHVLPAAQIAPKLVELTSTSSQQAEPSRSARILIVEDESVVAVNLQQCLTDMGYDPIDWISSGAAIDFVKREPPDLVLMDIRLAGKLNGIDAAQQIWQTQQIPIVYCTALADLETLKAVKTTESYGYVVKPFHAEAVRAAIELALDRREKELRYLPQRSRT